MFEEFLYILRRGGLKVSLTEWMSLMEALDKGLHRSSFTGFYHLCRCLLVKSEADFDRFDRCFLQYFRDVPFEGEADLRAWNAGEVDVLFAHPASTSYGLNMQAGGHVAVWLGTGFNAELYVQGNARLHRQGQKEPTRVYGLVAAGTAMEYAAGVVAGKVDAQDAMINFLKSKIHEEEVREHHE